MLCSPELTPHDRPPHPRRLRRRGSLPAMTDLRCQVRGRRPRRLQRPGDGRRGRARHPAARGRRPLPQRPGPHRRRAALGRRGPGRPRDRPASRRRTPRGRSPRSASTPGPSTTGGCAAGGCIGQPFHYRDERRGAGRPGRVAALIGAEELYRRNGLQYLPFNTLYQLAADDGLAEADVAPARSPTSSRYLACRQASLRAHQRLDDRAARRHAPGEWDTELMVAARPRRRTLPRPRRPRARDRHLAPRRRRTGRRASSRSSRSAPTTPRPRWSASPCRRDDAAYVSLGTWALAGLELDAPVLTEEARLANFTNEGGVDGTDPVPHQRDGHLAAQRDAAHLGRGRSRGDAPGGRSVYDEPVPIVDVQDERFLPPGDMQARIDDWCAEHGVPAPRGRVATVRCIVLSIAAAVATALERAASLAGPHDRRRARRRRRRRRTPSCARRSPIARACRCSPDRSRRRPSATSWCRRARPASSAPTSPTCGRWSPAPTTWRGSSPRG